MISSGLFYLVPGIAPLFRIPSSIMWFVLCKLVRSSLALELIDSLDGLTKVVDFTELRRVTAFLGVSPMPTGRYNCQQKKHYDSSGWTHRSFFLSIDSSTTHFCPPRIFYSSISCCRFSSSHAQGSNSLTPSLHICTLHTNSHSAFEFLKTKPNLVTFLHPRLIACKLRWRNLSVELPRLWQTLSPLD
jgi:hypothetical protein